MLLNSIRRLGSDLLTKHPLRTQQTIQNECKRRFSRKKPTDPIVRRRQYLTAAGCVLGGAIVVGVTFTQIPLGRLLCRVSPFTLFARYFTEETQ